MTQREKLAIAIDGPAGSGKSTVARRVARMLGYDYIDTGAMYRAVALAALRSGVSPGDAEPVAALARTARIELRSEDGRTKVWLDGEDMSEAVRRPEVSRAASLVSTISEVRRVLVEKQREMAASGGIVMEGRDIGSVVLPRADLKIFLTASPDVRARRRAEELAASGEEANFEKTRREVVERDRRDSERASSPLVAAADAVLVDSTAMERDEVARVIVMLAREKGKADSSLRSE